VPDQIEPPLTDDLRTTLGNLTEGLFDLAAWVNSPGKYTPPLPSQEMIWRAPGHRFSPLDLGVLPFFEGLLRESSGEADLMNRWASLGANPLQFCPLDNAQGWRANRGLTNPPQFSVARSANVLILDSKGRPLSRREFYALCWLPLRAVIDARKPNSPGDWAGLANDLAADQTSQWPNTADPRSSTFIRQFVCDVLYAMVGLRNPVAPPMRYALLVELGEHRRPGNHYEPPDAAGDVRQLRDLLDRLFAVAPPPAPPPPHMPPVGAPPHDKP
jgi:hypothetical protein